MNSPRETYSDGYDQPSFKLGGSALQSLISCLGPWTDCE